MNFSKNCDFSNFLQFLEKSQFLLGALLPPLPVLNLVILAKTDISPIFRYFMQTWTYLASKQVVFPANNLYIGYSVFTADLRL